MHLLGVIHLFVEMEGLFRGLPADSMIPSGGRQTQFHQCRTTLRFFIPLPLTRASSVRGRVIKNAQPKAGHWWNYVCGARGTVFELFFCWFGLYNIVYCRILSQR